MRRCTFLFAAFSAACLFVVSPAIADTLITPKGTTTVSVPEQSGDIAEKDGIYLNFNNVDIRTIIETVAKITKQNFLVDHRVGGKVRVISSEPVSKETFYQVFLTILETHGYSAVPGNGIIKIVPSAHSRFNNLPFVDGAAVTTGGEVVTAVINLRYADANDLVPLIRPLIPQEGHIAAYPKTNDLIVSATQSAIDRIKKILSRVDQPTGSGELEFVSLENASATEVVRIVQDIEKGNTSGTPEQGESVFLAVDTRSNSILLRGTPEQRIRIRTLISHLDTPIENDNNVQVIYLRYADATRIAPILKNVLSASGGGGAVANRENPIKNASQSISIEPDEHTNSLVITASPERMRSIKSIIRQLDIRKAQVLIEAIIADVSTDWAAELGVQWRSIGSDGLIGTVNFAGSNPVATALNIVDSNNMSLDAVGTGLVTGGKVDRWAILLNALRSDSRTNILSRPTLVTLDNEEANIFVGEDVPFIATSNSGTDNPYTTINRENVGIKLKVLPQINEGDAVQLKIEQEVSALKSKAKEATGAADVITTSRQINTNIIVQDNETIVLGGLIREETLITNQKVPLLGDIPILGNLFRYQKDTLNKTMLMVFLRPTILRTSEESYMVTNDKYIAIRAHQQEIESDSNRIIKEASPPLLDELLLPPPFIAEASTLLTRPAGNDMSIDSAQ